jgi:hypothetical protein
MELPTPIRRSERIEQSARSNTALNSFAINWRALLGRRLNSSPVFSGACLDFGCSHHSALHEHDG